MPNADDAARPLLDRLERDGIEHLWVSYVDYNGRSQGKSLPRARFEGTARRGITFARANLGHDLTDHSPSDTAFGADSGDFFAVPDPESYARYPLVEATARAVSWMRQEGGEPWDGCPRTALLRQETALAERGLTAQVAFEPEGYLFAVGPDGEPTPANVQGMFTVEALDNRAAFFHDVSDALEAMGIEVEQIAPEWAPGQFEVNLKHAAPIRAADQLVFAKDTARAVATRAGLLASFMPKPFEAMGGCGCHVHVSLWDAEGGNAMAGDGHPSGLSATGLAFLGGVLAHAAGLVGLGAPTANSYKRLQPGSWAPAHAAYSVGNRSSLVRIPGGARRRVEFRAGDNLANPYLFLAGLLAAGIDGLDRETDPGPPAEGDLGHMSAAELAAQGVALLPRSAKTGLDAVEADPVLMAALGPTIGPEWLRVKRSELATYDTVVSPWERAAYLRG